MTAKTGTAVAPKAATPPPPEVVEETVTTTVTETVEEVTEAPPNVTRLQAWPKSVKPTKGGA